MSVLVRLVGSLVAILVVLVPGTAFADPAGPTDYRSEITEIDPPTPTIRLDVLGGDSFVELTADAGVEVIVVGYQSEPYLWFQSDGTVLENQNAPSTYTNDERFGGGEIPPNASRDAEPDWDVVGSDGRYSWHDHRAHWMQTIRPAGKQVGDQIVEGVIPLTVDGVEVDVTVISTWKPEPSPVPAAAGAIGALALGAFATWRWRSGANWVAVVVPVATVAVIAGVLQYTSLPSETGPRLVWVALPVIAMIAGGVAAFSEQRASTFAAQGAVLVAGVQLLIWGVIKRDGLTAALIPTSAPDWFDRMATAGALGGGAALTGVAVASLFAPAAARA